MKSKLIVGAMVLVVVVSLLAAAIWGTGAKSGSRGVAGSGGAVGIIRINGPIMDGGNAAGLFGMVSGSASVMEQLRQAARDPVIKVVVLRINSPGGTTGASQEIAQEVDRLRKANKKVVASMGDMAASGGYWIACRCDKIIANPGTITGSIGVIVETQDVQGLYQKLGLESQVYKSGAHKDMGSPTRDVTPEEQRIFQAMVDQLYEQFVDTVSSGRNMNVQQVKKLADGRVFTGQQALDYGLVDDLGNFYDAIEAAAALAGIKGDPKVVEMAPKTSWWDTLASIKIDWPQFSTPAWLIYNRH